MNSLPTLLTSRPSDGVLQITINREAQLNALSVDTMLELEQVLEQARADANVRAVLITGAGFKAFAAGADINEFTRLPATESRAFAERGQRILQQLENMPMPVMAAVNGLALGGGCELALACHLRVASDNASFGLPEVKLGIIPGYGGTQRLTHLVGKGRALEMMLTGTPVPAAEAARIGLANHVVPAAELLPFCLELLGQMVSRAPQALARVLEAVQVATKVAGAAGYTAEAAAFEACCHTEDFQEGVAAFLSKRIPRFTGR